MPSCIFFRLQKYAADGTNDSLNRAIATVNNSFHNARLGLDNRSVYISYIYQDTDNAYHFRIQQLPLADLASGELKTKDLTGIDHDGSIVSVNGGRHSSKRARLVIDDGSVYFSGYSDAENDSEKLIQLK